MADESPLESLRVLDLSTEIAGAFCARLLADAGADVIAVEPPGGGPLRSHEAWLYLAAGKKSLTLDLGSEDGRELLRALMEETEVIVETFPAGRLESLGLGFEELRRLKRRIVLVSLDCAGGPAGAPWQTGLEAFVAALSAAMIGDANDNPQHIELAVRDTAAVAAALTAKLHAGARGDSLPALPGLLGGAAAASEPGEHTESLFVGELGGTPEQLADLRRRGVV